MDCTANSNICSKYQVSGYPTLKVFRDGEESGAYDGPRTSGWCCDVILVSVSYCDSCVTVCVIVVPVDGIVSYFKKQVGPASVTLAGEEEFQKFISEKDASVVGESLTSCSLHFMFVLLSTN